MATAITTAGTNQLGNSRAVVRDDGGILYAIVDQSDGTERAEVWKDGTDGSSWVEQQANANTSQRTVAVASDSAGNLHVVYHIAENMSGGTFYRLYTTATDTWGTAEEAIDINGGNVVTYGLSIAVDSNDIPHVVATGSGTSMGSDYDTVYYNNRIGGAWNASGLELEGVTNENNCRRPEILINESNIPVVVYLNETTGTVRAALGDANDAVGTWTFHTVDSTSITAEDISVAIDSGGDVWVGYVRSGNAYLAEHQDADGWTTWQTPVTNSNATGGTGVSVAIDGTDVYAFYEDDLNDVVYDKYTGSWSGETVLEAGTYNSVRVKWARYADFDSGGTDRGGSSGRVEFDVVFVDETASPDVLWSSLSLATGSTFNESVSLGVSAGYSTSAQTDFNPAITHGASLGFSASAQHDIVDSITAGVSAGFTLTPNNVLPASVTHGASLGITTAGGLLISDSITAGVSGGYAASAQTDFGPALTLGVSGGFSSAGQLDAVGTVSLGVGAGFTLTPENVISGAVSLGVSSTFATAGGLNLAESLSLGVAGGFTAAEDLTINLSVSLGESSGFTTAPQVDFNPSMALGTSAGYSTSAQTDLSAALSLGSAVGYSVTGILTLNESATLGVFLGAAAAGSLVIPGTLSLGTALGTTPAGVLIIPASVSLGVSLTFATSETLDTGTTYDEAVSMGVGLGLSVTNTASLAAAVSIGTTVGNTYTVPGSTYNATVSYGVTVADSFTFEYVPRGAFVIIRRRRSRQERGSYR